MCINIREIWPIIIIFETLSTNVVGENPKFSISDVRYK